MRKTPLSRGKSTLKKSGFKRKSKPKLAEKPLKKKPIKRSPIQQRKRKRNIRRKEIRKNSSSPLSKEIKLCDNVFSKYVRLLNTDKDGRVQCFTCEYKANWQKAGIQCSHFKSRGHYSTRWLKLNCEPGCVQCNEFLSGNLEVFAERLVLKHGNGILEYLDKESKRTVQLSVEKVKKLRLHFENEVLKLKAKLNL